LALATTLAREAGEGREGALQHASSSRGSRRGWLAGAGTLAVALLATAGWFYVPAVLARAELRAPAATPILYDRNGAFLTQVGHREREPSGELRIDYGYWSLQALPERVLKATLALEDRRFWSHPGVDPAALVRASWQNLTHRRRVSGASTLAMQVARMQQPQARSLWAKAVEAGTAVALTARYGREAVAAHYLRLVPYGNGSHGIAHAARFYLDKPVADLSWAEIALLSAIPQSPTLMNPLHADGLARARQRGSRMLDELGRQGVVGEAELAFARRQLAALQLPRAPQRPEALHAVLRLGDMVTKRLPAPPDATDPRIRTTIDLDTQAEVTKQARRFIGPWRGAGAEQAAVLVVDRQSRKVLAALGSTDYRDRRSGAIDFTRVERSPGSTLKPFIYALALERGLIKTSDVLADLPEGASGISNADGSFLGPMLPRQALANSRNIPATNLLRTIGLETTFGFLREVGVHDLDLPAQEFGLSMAIGSLPTTLERLVRAYGALADDGILADLAWIEGPRRRSVRRVLSADTARVVTQFLADPMARLPSFPRYGSTEYPFPVALKTGTSQGYRDAWVVAWSAKYMIGVWVGRGDAGPMRRLSGATSAAKLAQAVLLKLHRTTPGDLAELGFPAPEHRVAVELCVFGGGRSDGGCGQTLTEWVAPGEMPPVATPAVLTAGPDGPKLQLAMPAAHRAWAASEGYPLASGPAKGDGPVRLSVATPEHNTRLWRNPELPAQLQRLPLKAVVEPHVPQVVWYVDDAPFATADPDETVFWPLRPGVHRIQVRLPLQEGSSRMVRVVVE
jgi:penicillin-binding protein 1C